jgi:hypothetical protein
MRNWSSLPIFWPMMVDVSRPRGSVTAYDITSWRRSMTAAPAKGRCPEPTCGGHLVTKTATS